MTSIANNFGGKSEGLEKTLYNIDRKSLFSVLMIKPLNTVLVQKK